MNNIRSASMSLLYIIIVGFFLGKKRIRPKRSFRKTNFIIFYFFCLQFIILLKTVVTYNIFFTRRLSISTSNLKPCVKIKKKTVFFLQIKFRKTIRQIIRTRCNGAVREKCCTNVCRFSNGYRSTR